MAHQRAVVRARVGATPAATGRTPVAETKRGPGVECVVTLPRDGVQCVTRPCSSNTHPPAS